MMNSRAPGVLLASLSTLAFTATGSAQCSTPLVPAWETHGTVRAATTWDPDGTGPLSTRILLGGDSNGHVMAWEESTGAWTKFGAGLTGGTSPTAFAVLGLPNGEFVAGGRFTMAGSGAASNIARWNGSLWSAMGSGIGGPVLALALLPNGDLVAGGNFTTAGGAPASGIARWDGTTWSPLGTGTNGAVTALTVLANGDVVAGGTFTLAGGIAANRVARWDGTAWSSLGSGTNGSVNALATLTNGHVVAGGLFTTADGLPADRVARWDGTTWSALGSGIGANVNTLVALPNGALLAGGQSPSTPPTLPNPFPGPETGVVMQWNGTTWTSFQPLTWGITFGGVSVLAAAVLPSGTVVVGGWFAPYSQSATYAMRWNGASWVQIMDHGPNDRVRALYTLSNGSVVAGGDFTRIASVTANRVAIRIGNTWSPLGSGLNGPVKALTALQNGTIVAGGGFTNAGNYLGIAFWNGLFWAPLGGGVSGPSSGCEALARLPNGDVVAGGIFAQAGGVTVHGIARWNGVTWSPLGAGLGSTYWVVQVQALTALPNGDVIAAGEFDLAGGQSAQRIARWNGTSWSPMGAGLVSSSSTGHFLKLLTLANGDVVVGGSISSAGGQPVSNIARWNGVQWLPMGSGVNGPVDSLQQLPNGDLLVGGEITLAGGVSVLRLARWNGTAWSSVGTDVQSEVRAFTTLPDGDVLMGGAIGDMNLGRLTTTCPAIATSSGAGCQSSGGSNTLTATTLPWVDATFRATGTGLPGTALVLTLTSVTPFPQGAAPLSLVFPQAGPGCDVLTAPDILGLLVTTTGTAQSSFLLPNTPPILGVTFYHQMVPIQLDAQGNWVAVTATNALQLTAGMF